MIDKARIERAITEILIAIGEDPSREGLIETPKRVSQMYEEIFSGIGVDASEVTKMFQQEGCDGMVVVKDIPLFSMCEHHLLPFLGVANVVYIPNGKTVLGLSKIARITDILSRKPQLQERLCEEIAEVISNVAEAKGVFVSIEAEHLCMTMRGIKKPKARTICYASKGVMLEDASVRMEAMMLIGNK